MKRMLTAALVALLLAAPTAAAAVTPAPSPTSTPVECDPMTERPAAWDTETWEVILCESRGEGPATGPDCDPADCQLPTVPPVAEPAPPAPAEPVAPVVHEELAETGVDLDAELFAFVAGGLVGMSLGAAIVAIAVAWEKPRYRRRPNP